MVKSITVHETSLAICNKNLSYQKLTKAIFFKATSLISYIAGTVVVSHSVGACGIPVTFIQMSGTLINVCTRKINIGQTKCMYVVLFIYAGPIPLQANPSLSNSYPGLQWQIKLPIVLVQLWSHPPLSVSHSLMSER